MQSGRNSSSLWTGGPQNNAVDKQTTTHLRKSTLLPPNDASHKLAGDRARCNALFDAPKLRTARILRGMGGIGTRSPRGGGGGEGCGSMKRAPGYERSPEGAPYARCTLRTGAAQDSSWLGKKNQAPNRKPSGSFRAARNFLHTNELLLERRKSAIAVIVDEMGHAMGLPKRKVHAEGRPQKHAAECPPRVAQQDSQQTSFPTEFLESDKSATVVPSELMRLRRLFDSRG
jgi:hypothetical protein